MSNNPNVTLDTSVTPNVLDIDDSGGANQVNQNPNPQPITWHLTGNLAQGNFVSMSDPDPGFSWVSNPAPTCFSAATIGANGNSLSINDTHGSSSSNGSWIYMLRVNLNGTVYTTTASTGITATTNNPIIINR